MAVLYDVRFEKDPSVNCYGHWICLGGKVWVKEGDSITVYFDVRNYSSVKAYAVKIKLKDELGNCSEQSKLKDIDANSTASDNFVVYPTGNCRLKLTIELYDPDKKEYVEVDSKCCFEVSTGKEFPNIWPTYMGSTELVEGVEHTLWVKVYKSTDGGSEALSGVTVHHYIKRGGTYEWIECKISDEEGWVKFKWTPEKKAGETEWHKFEATTGGSSDHWYQSFTIIAKKNTHLTLTCPYSCEEGKTFTAKAELSYVTPEQKFEPLPNKTIDFYIDDVYKTSATTDSDGKASATLTCPSSSFTVKAKFAGDDEYEASEDTCSVSVTTPAPTPTPTPTPPPTTPTPTPPPTTPTPTPPPTTPPPGPPPAPKAKFEFVSAGFHYWETPEFKPEDYVSVSYDVENDEWKFEGETITEHLVPDTASALFFSGTVRQKETGASAVCEVRVYDELNDEVLLTVNSEEEISGEFSFGNQTYFYDGKERRIRIQVGAYEAGTWFKQDETEPLTLKSGKIAIEIKIKNVPEGVEPCVKISELSASGLLFVVGALPSKYGTRLFWTEDEIEKNKTYYVYLGQKEKFLGLIEYCGLRAGSIDSFTYTGTKIEKVYDWNEWVYLPSWMETVCSALGISPLCEDLWDVFSFFAGHWYIELTHTDPYTGEPVEPDTLTHVFCALDCLFFVPGEKIVGVVAQRGEAIAKIAGTSGKVSDWVKSISKSKLIRGIASMSGDTFEKKFLDKLAAEDTKAAEELLDSVLAAPEDTSVNIFKRIVDAIKNSRKTLKDAGRSVDDIEDLLSGSKLYAAHAEQTIEVAKDTLKGSWSDIRKLYDQFIAAWEKESPENIYKAVLEGDYVSVEHPVTKEMVSAFQSDIQELAGAPKVKVLVEGVEKEVETVRFRDIFHAFFLKEKDCVKSLKNAGLLDDFLDRLKGGVEFFPKTYRGLIKQLSDDEFAAIVADLKAEGKEDAAALFRGLREVGKREGARGVTGYAVWKGEADEAALEKVAEAVEDAFKATTDEKSWRAGRAVVEDALDATRFTDSEAKFFTDDVDDAIKTFKESDAGKKAREAVEKIERRWNKVKEGAEEKAGKKWSEMTTEERARNLLKSWFGEEAKLGRSCERILYMFFMTESLIWILMLTDVIKYGNWKYMSEEERTFRELYAKAVLGFSAVGAAVDFYLYALVRRIGCPKFYTTMIPVGAIVPRALYFFTRAWATQMEIKQKKAPIEEPFIYLKLKANVDDVIVIVNAQNVNHKIGTVYTEVPIMYIPNDAAEKAAKDLGYEIQAPLVLPAGQMDVDIIAIKRGYVPCMKHLVLYEWDVWQRKEITLELEPIPKEYEEVFSDIIEDVEAIYAEKSAEADEVPATLGGGSHPDVISYTTEDIAEIDVESTPTNAEVYLYDEGLDGGKWIPTTLLTNTKIRLPPGKYKVKVVDHETGKEEVREVQVYEGGIANPSKIDVVMGKPTPKATISYSPSDVYVGTEVEFSGAGSVGGDEESVVSYVWFFGDGATAEGVVVKHTFAKAGKYTVSLAVTNESGNTAIATKTITVKEISPTPTPTPPPCPSPSGVAISISPSSPTTDDIITFTGSAVDGDGHAIVSWEWNFGDGATASGQVVTHRFTKAGSYKVVLKVTNDCGAYATGSKTITVSEVGTPPPGCPKPTANISYIETTKPYEEQEIELSASGSSGGDTRSIISYEWDFGDGESATGVEVKHAWKKAGKYTVTLKVTNDCGATDTDTTTVTVNAINDVCDLIKARGGVSEITSVDIQQMILAFNGIIDYYFTVNRDAIYGMAAYKRGDIDGGDDLTGCKFAGFLRLWRLFEKMRR